MYVPMEIKKDGITPAIKQRIGAAEQNQYICLYGLTTGEVEQVKKLFFMMDNNL